MRYKKYACIFMLAIYAMLYEKANAQSAPCVVETTFLVNIQAKPTAGFNFIANDLSATFSNSSVNAMTYSWDFGDPNSGSSNTSTAANPIHHFSSSGIYTVTLTAINGCGTKSVTQTVQVTCPSISVTATANGSTQICPGTSILLTATPGFNAYQWLLNGIPIANSNAANFMASVAGEYTVEATDAAGCKGLSQGIPVELLPLAEPLFSTATNGLTVSFANTSTNSTSYSWNFGDPNSGASNTSSETNPTHQFSAPGSYTVTLTATNSCGTQSITQTVQPGCLPVAVSATANGSTQICPGNSILLTATAGFEGYQWLLNGIPIANSNTATFTASMAGEYTVEATDAAGCKGLSQGIPVELLPLAQPLFSTVTNGLSVSFANTSTNSTSYSWNFGDPNSGAPNTSSETNPTHDFSAPGTYTVTLTATNSCGTQSITQTVQPGCLPVAVSATANGSTEICPGNSILLTATPGFVGYQWLLNGNPIANGGNAANFSADVAGEYTVEVTDAAGCKGLSQGIPVELLPLAEPLFSTATNGLTVSFVNTSTNSTSYSWNFGDPNSGAPNTSSETNPTHDFSAPGTYLVTLTAMNACGSQTIMQEVVIACTPPQVSIASSHPLQLCEGGSALLHATSSNITIYQWYFNDLPIPSATSPTLSVTDAGQYKVLVTDIFGCENFSGSLVVEVYPLPVVSISGLNSDYTEDSPPVQLIGTPMGGIFSGAGLTGDQFDPSAAGVGQHTIYYTYTDANNCTNMDSAVVNVSPVSATNLPIAIRHIQVSPNPNQGDFWLKVLLSAERKLDFCLVNTLGQTLANRQELLPSGQTILHFSSIEWSSGVYFLKILDGEQYTCLRVIVNK